MNWFFSWLKKKLGLPSDNLVNESALRVYPTSPSTLESYGLNFTVHRANGGYIIEHRLHDRKTDRTNTSLHIITDDRDLGEELGKIIIYENLRS